MTHTTSRLALLAVLASAVAAASCARPSSQPGFSVRLPEKAAALSVDDAKALVATISIPGLLAETPLTISPDGSSATGTFTVNATKAADAPFTLKLTWRPDETTDVLLGRLAGTVHIAPHQANTLKTNGDFDTCGAADGEPCTLEFDLNRNGSSNLDDLTAPERIDPRAPPPFVDVAPSDLTFPSGIRLGSFARQVIVVENTSADRVDAKATLIDAPGATMSLFSTDPQPQDGAQRTLDLGTLEPFTEVLVAVSFAPVNNFLTVGDVFVEAVNERTHVPQATRVRLLANVDGELQPPPASFDVPAIGGGDRGGYQGQVETFPTTSLFNGLPVNGTESDSGSLPGLAYTGQTLTATFADGAHTVPADDAFLVEIPPKHKLAVSLSNLASDVDLSVFLLGDGDAVSDDPAQNFRIGKAGTSPEALEHKNTSDSAERALVVIGRVEQAPAPETSGGLAATDLAPFQLSAQVTSAPEFTAPVGPLGGPLEGGTRVTLRGEGFNAGATVTFADSVALDCTFDGTQPPATVFECTTPPGSLLVGHNPATVVVANPSQDEGGDGQAATLPEAFTYDPPAPRLDDISPDVAPTTGSTGAITLVGAFFSHRNGNPKVFFDDVDAADVVYVDSTHLQVTAPAHAAGISTVSVRNILDPQPGDPAGTVNLSLPSNVRNFTFVAPDHPAPTVTAVSPSTGSIDGGTVVSLTGTNFIADPAPSVLFDGVAATNVTVDSDTSITCTAPAHTTAATVDVELINGDGQRDTLAGAYSYFVPSPALSTVFPASGTVSGGTFVVLTGTGFRAGARVDFVDAGGTAVASPNANRVSTTTILAATPGVSAGGSYTVRVTNLDGQHAEITAGFTYLVPEGDPPRIDSIVPNTGSTLGGDQITITGGNFRQPAVLMGSTAVTDVVVDTSSAQNTITFRSPPADSAGPVVVRVIDNDGQSDTIVFSYVQVFGDPPIIDTVSPGAAKKGDILTLRGRNFDVVSDGSGGTVLDPAASLFVGGQAIANPTATATSLSFPVPNLDGLVANGASVAVELRNGDGQGTSATFAYQIPAATGDPRIDAVTPGAAKVGDTVEIDGVNFNLLSLKVGGATLQQNDGAIQSKSATAIRFTVPNPGGTLPAVVALKLTNADGRSASATLGVNPTLAAPPRIDSVAPNQVSTAGGTAVTLAGSFTTGGTLKVAGATVTPTSVTSTSVVFNAPAHAAGSVALAWANPDGQSASGTLAYVATPQAPPRIDTVTPAQVSTAGGTAVTLAGAFATGGTLKVAGAAVTPTASSSTSVAFNAPAHAAGTVAVTWTNPDGQSTTASLTYAAPPAAPPRIDAVSPDHAPTAGGVQVTLSGSFTTGGALKLGGAAVTPSSVTSTRVVFTAPAHAAAVVNLTWTNPDGQSASASFGYSDNSGGFVPPPPAVGLVSPNLLHALVPGDVVDLVGQSLATATGASIEDAGGAAVGAATIVDQSDVDLQLVVDSALPDAAGYRFRVAFSDGSSLLSPGFTAQRPTVQAVVPNPTNGSEIIFGSLLNPGPLQSAQAVSATGTATVGVLSRSETTLVIGAFPPSVPGLPVQLQLVYDDPVNGGQLPPVTPLDAPDIGESPLPIFTGNNTVLPAGPVDGLVTLAQVGGNLNDPTFGKPAGFVVTDASAAVVASGDWVLNTSNGSVELHFTSSAPVAAGSYDLTLATDVSAAIARTQGQAVEFRDRSVDSLSPAKVFDGAPGTVGIGTAFVGDLIVLENVGTSVAVSTGSVSGGGGGGNCAPNDPACQAGTGLFQSQFPVFTGGQPDGDYRVCVVAPGAPIACPSSTAVVTLAPLSLTPGLRASRLSDKSCTTTPVTLGGDDLGALAESGGLLYADSVGGTVRLDENSGTSVDLLPQRDALFSDTATGVLFSLTDANDAPFTTVRGGETANGFVPLDPTTLLPNGPVVPLASALTLDFNSALFSGPGIAVFWDAKDGGWRLVDLADGSVGLVALTQRPQMLQCPGAWASFGVAEASASTVAVDFASDPSRIARLTLPTLKLENIEVATRPPPGALCGITTLTATGRWAARTTGGQQGLGDEALQVCPASYCGDAQCSAPDESAFNCPEDCAQSCGNGICEPPNETNASCPQDCTSTCGNGTCEQPSENDASCPSDCPLGNQPAGFCGDGFCAVGEQLQCGQDCGGAGGQCFADTDCPAGNVCDPATKTCVASGGGTCNGNGVCEPQLGESNSTCGDCFCGDGVCSADDPQGCGDCGAGSCGNGFCDAGEDPVSCPGDCGGGGTCNANAVCEPQLGETDASCPGDCFCGDGQCVPNEDPASCPGDCGGGGGGGCGDGVIDPGEECDDGNVQNGDGCSTSCTFESLQSAQQFPAGGVPFGVVTADLNNDGFTDVAVTDLVNGNVEIFAGTGTGQFSAPSTISTEHPNPEGIVVGDFNNDSRADLAVANNGDASTTILLQQPNPPGTFSVSTAPAPPGAVGIAAGDMNHDGNEDLAISGSGFVGVLLGNGAGGFTTAGSASQQAAVTSIAMFDMDGDGSNDVVAGGATDATTVSISFGDGAGGLELKPQTTFGAGGQVEGVAVADFDNNGRLDVVAATSGLVVVAFQDAAGKFNPIGFNGGGGQLGVTAGNINSDPFPDIAVATAGGVTVLLSNGAGNFLGNPSAILNAGPQPHGLTIGNVNNVNDGISDLVVADEGGAFAVLLGALPP